MLRRAGAGRCAHELAGDDSRSLLRLCPSSAFLPQAPMTESLRDAPACSDGALPLETSRALNLSMTVAQVDRHCRENSVAISALEALPDGGTRLVCMSNYGAAQIRLKLGNRIIDGPVRRERFRPIKPSW